VTPSGSITNRTLPHHILLHSLTGRIFPWTCHSRRDLSRKTPGISSPRNNPTLISFTWTVYSRRDLWANVLNSILQHSCPLCITFTPKSHRRRDLSRTAVGLTRRIFTWTVYSRRDLRMKILNGILLHNYPPCITFIPKSHRRRDLSRKAVGLTRRAFTLIGHGRRNLSSSMIILSSILLRARRILTR
jgi:hypothetical protein